MRSPCRTGPSDRERPGAAQRRTTRLRTFSWPASGRSPGRVVDGREAALTPRLTGVGEVLATAHGRQDRDPATVDPDLGLAQLAGQHDPAATGSTDSGPVLDPAPADAPGL